MQPGSDGALALSITGAMLDEGWFDRIRHYGVFANGNRTANIARSDERLEG